MGGMSWSVFVTRASRFSWGTKLIWFMLISVLATDTSPTRCRVVKAEESCQRDWKQVFKADAMFGSEDKFDFSFSLFVISNSVKMALSGESLFKAVSASLSLPSPASPYHPGSINESLFPRVSSPNETGLTGLRRPSLSTHTSSMLGSRSQECRHEIMSWAT